MHQIPMTLKGAEKLRKELEELKTIKRPMMISAIANAREHGDLKENAEYHAAREEQSFCEGRIKELESKLSHAQVIDVTKISSNANGRAVFGSTVTVRSIETNEKFTYCIVGDDEANFKHNLISINSPMARGLIGKTANALTVIQTPGGNVEYKIIKVEYI
ncbi:Transcription elongation factor GreA [Candidatus Erwinia haradaeae]|uniref:Transcription elongation factor GreA n=1 Tax=Candidatus Erwinia haradaeae TaxID=1922217 RepID=A0A451DDB1_9GAMM|nr:transcription elongation factor GreA [Candidatus Erwinia haradaeae]VFP84449.1 Transcription elongation factor GreA [Candidatus Erwinia haradaeae]